MVYIRLTGPEGMTSAELTAPVGPGLIRPVHISAFRLLEVGDEIPVQFRPSILALDGEREVEIHRDREVVIRLSDRGPRVVDVGRALALAAQQRCFYTSDSAHQDGCFLFTTGICQTPCR